MIIVSLDFHESASKLLMSLIYCFLLSEYRYVQSWIDTREVQSEKANLTILFDKYVPSCLETLRQRFKKITPIAECSHIQMLCYLLECLLSPENTPADSPKELYELYFVFACVWAFGGAMFQDQVKKKCSLLKNLFKSVVPNTPLSKIKIPNFTNSNP